MNEIKICQSKIQATIIGINAYIDYIQTGKQLVRRKNFKIISNNSLSKTKGSDEELKNIRKRIDGRWEYRKTINGITSSTYANNQKALLKKVKKLKTNKAETKEKYILIDLIEEWYNLYKSGIKSHMNYRCYINKYFKDNLLFKKDIRKVVFEEIEKFVQNIKLHRVQSYCYLIIKGVFKNALKREIIEKDISQFLEIPKRCIEKGSAFTLAEQKLIFENLNKTKIKNEILFFLLTGARRGEAIAIKSENINFEKLNIFIYGTKTKNAKRYIPISKDFAELLKKNFNNMFKFRNEFYTKKFKVFLNTIGIKNKTLHDLRHTFSTNLYYIGVPDKQRQYYMGHSSIVITNDIYTTLDPSTTKNDILKLYNNLYPKF